MAKLTKEEILKAQQEYKEHSDKMIEEQRIEFLQVLQAYKQAPSSLSKEEKKKLKEAVKEERRLLYRLIKIAKRHIKTIEKYEDDEIDLVPPDPEIFDALKKD